MSDAPTLQEALSLARQFAGQSWSSLVIDCDNGRPRLDQAAKLGEALGAKRYGWRRYRPECYIRLCRNS